MNYVPSRNDLVAAIEEVMKNVKSVISTAMMDELVAEQLQIPEEMFTNEDGEFFKEDYSYRMRWARTYLKKEGKIRNVRRGEWAPADK